jgi:hypothetical protein
MFLTIAETAGLINDGIATTHGGECSLEVLLLVAKVRNCLPGGFQAGQEVPFVLNALILDELHFLGIRIGLDHSGALRGEPVHPGYEIGTDKVDEIARGKPVSVGRTLHFVTSRVGTSSDEVCSAVSMVWATLLFKYKRPLNLNGHVDSRLESQRASFGISRI